MKESSVYICVISLRWLLFEPPSARFQVGSGLVSFYSFGIPLESDLCKWFCAFFFFTSIFLTLGWASPLFHLFLLVLLELPHSSLSLAMSGVLSVLVRIKREKLRLLVDPEWWDLDQAGVWGAARYGSPSLAKGHKKFVRRYGLEI